MSSEINVNIGLVIQNAISFFRYAHLLTTSLNSLASLCGLPNLPDITFYCYVFVLESFYFESFSFLWVLSLELYQYFLSLVLFCSLLLIIHLRVQISLFFKYYLEALFLCYFFQFGLLIFHSSFHNYISGLPFWTSNCYCSAFFYVRFFY